MYRFKCYKGGGKLLGGHLLPWAGLSGYMPLTQNSGKEPWPFCSTSASCPQSHPLKPSVLTELREGKENSLPPRK